MNFCRIAHPSSTIIDKHLMECFIRPMDFVYQIHYFIGWASSLRGTNRGRFLTIGRDRNGQGS